jgi:hypothetical protein
MVAVALLYGTPPDAAAELRFLRAMHYPVGRIELGEEPDGQLAGPETYGALYVQAARALHSVDPRAQLGGPSLQTSTPDWEAWDDGRGSTSWTRRFFAYLRARHAYRQLRFFSFEWYPFDDVCAAPAPRLMRAPALLADVLHRQELDGLPRSVPRVISEYGYSAFAGRAEADLPGALFDAEAAAQFLTLGGEASYLYGYEPEPLMRESRACNTWGNLALWQSDDEHRIIRPLAALHAMRLVTGRWARPGRDRQTLYAASVEGRGTDPPGTVTAYALRRPDGKLAILLINKDPHAAHPVRALLQSPHQTRPLDGPADLFQLSPAQYVWHPRGERGFARPDRPPAHVRVGRGPLALMLPASSISVLQVGMT